jgi:hypothetical protein
MSDDDIPPFIPPAPVKPGFDRNRVVVVSDREYWGYNARPSQMKVPLPEGWRPTRTLSPEEEERLIDMTLWAKAHGIEMANWDAFWEGSWLRKYNRTQKQPLPGSKGAMSNALDKLDQFIARTDGPRDGGQIGPPIARGLPKPERG